MTDPLGLIGSSFPVPAPGSGAGAGPGRAAPPTPGAPSFADTLRGEIEDVNRLQQDAKQAVEDLAAGRRNDLESVIIATEKADTAFRMLLAVRNKMMDAYQEVKDLRV